VFAPFSGIASLPDLSFNRFRRLTASVHSGRGYRDRATADRFHVASAHSMPVRVVIAVPHEYSVATPMRH